ncbi:flagellar protein FliT [Halobacillus yeomjeoni]|uniref:flagellar protein FliT n=1 Tax=Halobacillus yeomjeoni TaxID=311194 RepID=UPI001CD58F89|nr:flagellar protein FliT [Halobacillus yeomjeoni]MCA0984668.1 flagellar protein FliT [Halobacillus yeomjeoni]
MSLWKEFLTLTEKLDETVHQTVTEKNRSTILDDVDLLLDQRSDLIQRLPQPADSEMVLLDEVKKRDLKINQRLEFLLSGLKQDMRNMKKQKTSKQRYTNPYQSVSSFDGMYLDQKK